MDATKARRALGTMDAMRAAVLASPIDKKQAQSRRMAVRKLEREHNIPLFGIGGGEKRTNLWEMMDEARKKGKGFVQRILDKL